VPAVTPVTSPLVPTVAKVLLADHTPPLTASVRITLFPTQTEEVSGAIGAEATTLTVACETQAPKVYFIVSRPEAIPVTRPEDTVACVLVALHVPPVPPTVSVVVNPVHTAVTDGVTGDDIEFTVTVVVAVPELQVATVATTE